LEGKGAEPDPARRPSGWSWRNGWLPEAQELLAGLYLSGQGVARDGAGAGRWCRAAADQGDAKAMYELGRIFAGGRLAPQDLAEAYMWFTLAAERGQEEARLALEQLDRNLDEGVRREASDLAARWKAAAPGR
jgi:TPR repeat protein